MKAPFPYAGGKSWIAPHVWQRLGPVVNYVEPCCGSAAMLLARPTPQGLETLNDRCGFLINAYRSIRADPSTTAAWCDWPVSEVDLFARHAWLLRQQPTLVPQLEADPCFYDPQIAGWWIWGAFGSLIAFYADLEAMAARRVAMARSHMPRTSTCERLSLAKM